MFSESNRTKNYVVRLTPEEYQAVKKAAALKGVTLATYFRQAVYSQVKQDIPELVTNT